MLVTIDKVGRIVIPSEVRERLDLAPGTALDLDVSREAIVLVPERRSTTTFTVVDGVAVFPAVGAPITVADVQRLRDADQR